MRHEQKSAGNFQEKFLHIVKETQGGNRSLSLPDVVVSVGDVRSCASYFSPMEAKTVHEEMAEYRDGKILGP